MNLSSQLLLYTTCMFSVVKLANFLSNCFVKDNRMEDETTGQSLLKICEFNGINPNRIVFVTKSKVTKISGDFFSFIRPVMYVKSNENIFNIKSQLAHIILCHETKSLLLLSCTCYPLYLIILSYSDSFYFSFTVYYLCKYISDCKLSKIYQKEADTFASKSSSKSEILSFCEFLERCKTPKSSCILNFLMYNNTNDINERILHLKSLCNV